VSLEKKKQNYHVETPQGEVVFTKPGNRGPNDMKIFTEFPYMPWPTSLYYIGVVLRLKGAVEDRNYPNGRGRFMLKDFIGECIERKVPIVELCKKYKIPLD